MVRLLLIVVCSLFFPLRQHAQELTWKQHEKLAAKLIQKHEYAQAAMEYEKAWKAKPSKKELIYKAAEAYYLVRDFRQAANAYQIIKEDNATFDLVGLKYARSLKQIGQYDVASREFIYFINDYKGPGFAALSETVQEEILGCELGMKQKEILDSKNVEVEHLSENINTIEPEFAPIAFADDILYFSSLKMGKAKIFRSQKKGGLWTKAQLPSGFAKFKDEHFCNGSFTPDYGRFYFTICQKEQVWGGLSSRCDIYVTSRNGDTWTNPEKLHDGVNTAGYTNTHPYSVIDGDTEILYFSSNRIGGSGGMDIWYAERPVNSDNLAFSKAKNAGYIVNSSADEITPFYDNTTGTLYFSSNGHINIGGYDVMKAQGKKNTFGVPENMGMPINSPADDNYYIHLSGGSEGFFVSNRTYGMEKITTTQEDIFSFGNPVDKLMVQGKLLDENGLAVNDVEVALYELIPNASPRLWSSKNFSDGAYVFTVLPGKQYELRAEKEQYLVQKIAFDTYNQAISSYTKDISIQKTQQQFNDAVVSSDKRMIETPTEELAMTSTTSETFTDRAVNLDAPTTSSTTNTYHSNTASSSSETNSSASVANETAQIESTAEATGSYNLPAVIRSTPEDVLMASTNNSANSSLPAVIRSTPEEVVTPPTTNNTGSSLPGVIRSTDPEKDVFYATNDYNSPNYSSGSVSSPSGVYYKIQIIAVKKYQANNKRYRPVKDLARIDTEYFAEQDVTRVLLSDFFSEKEANKMLEKVQERGFNRAFIVKYQNGQRVKRIRK